MADWAPQDDSPVLAGFGRPVAFSRPATREFDGVGGVHVVWSSAGELVYVGESQNIGRRLRDHLDGDRTSSNLHHRVGEMLDAELGRPATRDDVRGWLESSYFAVRQTAEGADLKSLIMRTLAPRFNRNFPPGRVVAVDDLARLPSLFGEVFHVLANRAEDEDRLRASRDLIRRQIPEALSRVIPPGFVTRGSLGMGDLADVPWVAVFRATATGEPSARQGLYVVYLFAYDGSGAYLALAQGIEGVAGGAAVLRKRALDVRAAVPAEELLTEITLHSTNQRPRRYEAATVYARHYPRDTLPSTDQLRDDLLHMLGLLSRVDEDALGLTSPHEPLHVVLKWNPDRNPVTVDIHRAIADERGSVWWGRFAKTPGSTAMSRDRLDALRTQLLLGLPTYCVIYRSGEVWLARLHEITADRGEVDTGLLPSYYSVDDCNLFVRISDFERKAPTWAAENILLAANPDPAAVPGALGNQTTPLLVYLRRRSEQEDAPAFDLPAAAPTVEWLAEETLVERSVLEEMLEALAERPQIILAGPPGTGKTRLATHLARMVTGDAPLARELVQFHPSYGYEDFIEGLRPTRGKEGGVTFEPTPGALLKLINRMSGDADQMYALIIDEMNRANLPRVFGELMYLIEYRDAGEPIQLLHRDDFTLPSRLAFIGTMNTADRSIRSIDIALRRRFEIFDCPPDAEILSRYYATRSCEVDGLVDGFSRLNEWLTELIDRHHTVGHTFFMREHFTPRHLRAVWTRQLLPLLEDYFFDQPALVADLRLERFWPGAVG